VSGPGGASAVRLSKIDDYLADKICVLMLSEVMGGIQEQSGLGFAAGSKSGI
jgi:hypothetical protein